MGWLSSYRLLKLCLLLDPADLALTKKYESVYVYERFERQPTLHDKKDLIKATKTMYEEKAESQFSMPKSDNRDEISLRKPMPREIILRSESNARESKYRSTPHIFNHRRVFPDAGARRAAFNDSRRDAVKDVVIDITDPKTRSPKETDDGQSSVTSAYKTRCCGELAFSVNKKFVAFIVQTMVILAVLIFAMHQAVNGENNRKETFLIIITTILSVYLPSPQVPNINNEKSSKAKKKATRR